MKYLFLFIISSLLIVSLKSPDTSQSETSVLYERSLLYYMSEVENTDTIYILKCFDIELSSRIGKYHIVDISDNTKSFLKDKKGLGAIKILPIEVNNGNIEVGVIYYLVKEENGEIKMVWVAAGRFIYKYNSKSKQYKLIDRKRYTI